jgi:hypothetical protein
VDSSGAVIAGATVQVRNANDTVLKTTRTDRNGYFVVSGLPSGSYRLITSNPDFKSKEISITLEAAGAPAPLRVTLAVHAVSTTMNVQGRADDPIGIASSAGEVTVGAEELKNRPILRSGEILETLPGLIITQHAGGGKANQYFMRGFNLDHGTDFAVFIDGMPLNLPSHAHGEGYSDMNTVIPEFVERVDAEKGPYYGDVGDYGSAGNAHLVMYKTLAQNFVQVDGGMYQFARFVFGVSRKLGPGNLLYGGEAYHDGGPWVHPDNYYKFNGLMTYSQGSDDNGFSVTARGYAGTRWNSSDQLPNTAFAPTAPNQIGNYQGFFGALNPEDGGHSHRYSLQGEWHRIHVTLQFRPLSKRAAALSFCEFAGLHAVRLRAYQKDLPAMAAECNRAVEGRAVPEFPCPFWTYERWHFLEENATRRRCCRDAATLKPL